MPGCEFGVGARRHPVGGAPVPSPDLATQTPQSPAPQGGSRAPLPLPVPSPDPHNGPVPRPYFLAALPALSASVLNPGCWSLHPARMSHMPGLHDSPALLRPHQYSQGDLAAPCPPSPVVPTPCLVASDSPGVPPFALRALPSTVDHPGQSPAKGQGEIPGEAPLPLWLGDLGIGDSSLENSVPFDQRPGLFLC